MIVSLLSTQSRTSKNAEVASQLAIAANRVATIERVHRGFIISMGYAALRLNSTWRIFVAIFQRCCSRGIALSGSSSSKALRSSCPPLPAFR